MEIIFDPVKEQVSAICAGSNISPALFFSFGFKPWRPVLITFKDDSAILAHAHDGEWRLFGHPLAPSDERIGLLFQLAHHLFSRNLAKRIVIESDERRRWEELQTHSGSFRLSLSAKVQENVFELASWPPESLHKLAHSPLRVSPPLLPLDAKALILAWGSEQGIKEVSHALRLADAGFVGLRTLFVENGLAAWWAHEKTAYFALIVAKAPATNEAVAFAALAQMRSDGCEQAIAEANTTESLHPQKTRISERFSLLTAEFAAASR